MRTIRFSLVELPAAARAAATTAASEAFPQAEIIEVAHAEEMMQREPSPGLELLVVADVVSVSLSQLVQLAGEAGLPRWAVVALGRSPSDLVETVPPEDWNPRLLARVFRSALLQHELLCENLRLRGDLKTVARRFSHDLITPVGCINTSACVLKILPPEESQTIAAIVQNIEDSSAEISALIERMSFVVRASAEPAVPVEVEMEEVAASVLKQLETALHKTGATVTLPAAWLKVSGISKWLEVIWRNLLENALKHGGAGVRIRLTCRAKGEWREFSVSDNGAGVAPALRSGLFRRFDQLHAHTGAGLGLSIVQRLISLQGGSCGYENNPEGGSRFYFSLPAATE